MTLPPENKPLEDVGRVREFLTKIIRKLRDVEVTATGRPKGFLWVFWRMENSAGKVGSIPPGSYLDLSVYYIPRVGRLSRKWWEISRKGAPEGFPHVIVPG